MEKIDLKKAAKSFISGLDYFKTAMILIKILTILAVLSFPFFVHKDGFKKGEIKGFSTGYSQALREHPPVTINGDKTIVNQNKETARGFRACVFPFSIGW